MTRIASLVVLCFPSLAFAGTGPFGFVFGSGYEIAAGVALVAAVGAKTLHARANNHIDSDTESES